MGLQPVSTELAATDAGDKDDDIRGKLRRDHLESLAELEALRWTVGNAHERLQCLRRSWMTHALAEESVVYRALDGVQSADSGTRADDRFAEHEWVVGIFDGLSQTRPGTPEWHARLDSLRDLMARHAEGEQPLMFARLGSQFDPETLLAMGRNFELARNKLTFLEDAKAA